MPLTPEEAHSHALQLMYNSGHVVGIIPQSIVYGIYLTLISMSSYIMLKKGLKTRVRRFLFGMTLGMFAYSTVYMAISIASLIQLIRAWFLAVNPTNSQWSGYDIQLFSAIGLINYVLTDGVVVWRAWVLCRDDSRKGLVVCISLLLLASMSVLTTIVIRIAIMAVPAVGSANKMLTRAINITQVANLAFSLLTNLLATSIVSIKAWRHRQWFMEMRSDLVRRMKPRASRVMALMIESGILYCISLVTVLVTTIIPLPVGTLGDIYTPVNVQLAGIYPIMVLLLVNQDRSLDRTDFINPTISLSSAVNPHPNSTEPTAITHTIPPTSMVLRAGPGPARTPSITTPRTFSIPTSRSPTNSAPRDHIQTKDWQLNAESYLDEKCLPDIPLADNV